MDVVLLSRLQFGLTTIYHFFFVPLTIGLTLMVAIMETMYVKKGNEDYKRMAKFWGKLLLINFAMGIVTGIVQEFQFGMNWSSYSRYVGDIFGAPLAIACGMYVDCGNCFVGICILDFVGKLFHAKSGRLYYQQWQSRNGKFSCIVDK